MGDFIVARPLLVRMQRPQQGRENHYYPNGKPYEIVRKPTYYLIIQAQWSTTCEDITIPWEYGKVDTTDHYLICHMVISYTQG